jgi:hypothetical protein
MGDGATVMSADLATAGSAGDSQSTRSEGEQLRSFLVARLDGSASGAESGQRRPEELAAFLQHRFAEPLRHYRRGERFCRWGFGVLSVAGIAAGVISSGVAAGWSKSEWARIVILVAGLIAATSATIMQIWRPGPKAAARARAADALIAEGWAFINGRGRYAAANTEPSAVDVFVEELMRIGMQVSEVDAVAAEPDLKPEASGKRARPPRR